MNKTEEISVKSRVENAILSSEVLNDGRYTKQEKLGSLYNFDGVYTGEDWNMTQRWFSTGDVVEFIPNIMYSSNGEFKINGDDNWLIWFSQLNEPLYDGTAKLKFSCILMKNGQDFIIPKLSLSKFLEITRGKKFQVIEQEYKTFGVNKKNPIVNQMRNNIKIYDYVSEMIDKGDFKDVMGMLRPRRAYVFTEI